MKLSLLILASPNEQGAHTALRFAREALQKKHNIYRIFFLSEGTLNSQGLAVFPQDKPSLPLLWQELAEQHNIDIVTCVSSALSRGVIDDKEAKRYERHSYSINPSHYLSGLGQLIDAYSHSDRLITFG